MNNTIHALTRKRRELTCQMNALADSHAQMGADLEALDAVLRMIDPDIDLSEIPALKVINRPAWARKGEIIRLVFTILRKANGPMTTDEIAARVAMDRGETKSARIRKSVYKALDMARQRGNVCCASDGLWEVVR